MRRPTLALVACMSLVAVATGAHAAPLAAPQTQAQAPRPALLSVGAGQAARVALSAPVRDVVVGDPQVADVSVVNERTLIVLGKKAGATTLLAFDARGQALADRQIVVTAIPDQAVVVQRGTKATSYACGDRCSSLTPDDAPAPAAAATP